MGQTEDTELGGGKFDLGRRDMSSALALVGHFIV